MQRKFRIYGEVNGDDEVFYETAKEEIEVKLEAHRKTLDTAPGEYRKSLLQTIESMCMYDSSALDLFHNYNYTDALEHGLFSDKRLEHFKVQAMQNLKV